MKHCSKCGKKLRSDNKQMLCAKHYLEIGWDIYHQRKVCAIIKKHHEDMKDDPEHLTTEFIQKMVGRKCI